VCEVGDEKCSTLKHVFSEKYLLFVGRIEERKNIKRIIGSFEYIKEKYGIPHKLVLAGKPGYNHGDITARIADSSHKDDIMELGFVSEEEKWELLRHADVFVFPTLYEGFGIPILEAQSMMVPVVASRNSSIPEVADSAALLVDPLNIEDIGENINILISNPTARDDLIRKGYENSKRFSWAQCARDISRMFTV
jgi:glycosyltransferase involved in cell wall biosynthesis